MLSNNKINNQKSEKKPLNVYAKYSMMGFQMGAIIALGIWGGISLDKYFQTKFPGFTLTLSLVSIVFAMYWMIRDFTKKK